jgi:N-acyl-D-aspartate/D-glutamate deacylase
MTGLNRHYDLVIANGRVIDPATGLDAARHVGINGHRIAAISEEPLAGPVLLTASLSLHGPTAAKRRPILP